MLPEVAARRPRYRNTLPFVNPGVETVELLRRTRGVPPFGPEQPRTLRYRGETFETASRWVEDEDESTETETTAG